MASRPVPRLLLGAQVVLLAAGVLAVPAVGSPAAPPAPVAVAGTTVLSREPVAVPAASAAAPAVVPAAVAAGTPSRRAAAAPARASRAAARLTPQQRGERALAALRYPWRSLGYAVRFRPYTGGRLGEADAPSRTITVYVKPGQDELELRTTIAHELGHALDFAHGTEARRAEYRRVRGLGGGSWYPCYGCDDLSSPAGDWAEVFAAALVGPGDFRSRLAGPPTAEQLRRLAPLFAVPRSAARTSTPPSARPSDPPASEQDDAEDGLLPIWPRLV